ncbi:MAG: hypothetical protein LBP76_09465 [Treponema sp.]|jgi:hypothetical protein|nr:hypothetical protein [Treponema sp.]
MKVYEQIAISDHIRFDAFTHAALSKGDVFAIPADGTGIKGHVDASNDNEVANSPVTLDVGVARAIFRAASSDVAGTPAVGAKVYQLPAGTLTTDGDATGAVLTGVITSIQGAVSFVKVGD